MRNFSWAGAWLVLGLGLAAGCGGAVDPADGSNAQGVNGGTGKAGQGGSLLAGGSSGAPAASGEGGSSAGGGSKASDGGSGGSLGQAAGMGNVIGGTGGASGGTGGASVGTGGGPVGTGGASGGTGGAGGGVVPGGKAYPGKGFVVHEWGTNTIVLGSDGVMLRGLHHEEEDLPAFVYDRLKAGMLPGSTSQVSVDVKMETPVTYFYSDTALTAKVSVDFPMGIFTQWYPAVSAFFPPIVTRQQPNGTTVGQDIALDPHASFSSPECKAKVGTIADGLLDWGTVQIMAPGADLPVPEASLDQYTWSFARQVASNLVTVAGVPGVEAKGYQAEKFLFYRGLGNFALPVLITQGKGGSVSLANPTKTTMGPAFVVRAEEKGGAFQYFPQGITPGASIDTLAPAPGDVLPLGEYLDELGKAVTAALDDTGLYHDEAVAMVNTWKRQWFSTPGLRAFYLLPQPMTELQIPLSVSPAPSEMVRVMMIRAELITPEQEAVDASVVKLFAGPVSGWQEAEDHFTALGRFAEPRLRRAIAVGGSSDGAEAFLKEIELADTRQHVGE